VLQVVIVSGLDAAERFRVCGSLAGASDAAEPARSEVEDETEDSGEFALMLADRRTRRTSPASHGRSSRSRTTAKYENAILSDSCAGVVAVSIPSRDS
ncbi:hypothetical protein IAE22_29950, partial [Bacillus sp. S34]|nr:hypothetical protein [Bacillus sp. S34]